MVAESLITLIILSSAITLLNLIVFWRMGHNIKRIKKYLKELHNDKLPESTLYKKNR